MKILLLTDGIFPYSIGGIQKHSAGFARSLLQCGVRLHIYSTFDSEDQAEELRLELKSWDPSVELTSFILPEKRKLPGHYLKSRFDLSKMMKQQFLQESDSFDLIYAQGFTAWAFPDQEKLNIPVLVNPHGLEMFQKSSSKMRSRLESIFMRAPIRRMSRSNYTWISLGGKLTALIEELGVEKTIVHPNAIEARWLADELPPTATARNFLFVGRNERRKGFHQLMEVIPEFASPEVQFHFVGPFEAEEEMEHLHFHGQLSDQARLMEIYDRADVLLVPSESEGQPTVILEAMARGKAIAATDVGAVRTMLDEENGILMENNEVESIRLALEKFILMPAEDLHALKLSSRRKVESFEWMNLTRQFVEGIKTTA